MKKVRKHKGPKQKSIAAYFKQQENTESKIPQLANTEGQGDCHHYTKPKVPTTQPDIQNNLESSPQDIAIPSSSQPGYAWQGASAVQGPSSDGLPSPTVEKDSSSSGRYKHRQFFDYLLVYDLEASCDQSKTFAP